jgi:hypothetical protein
MADPEKALATQLANMQTRTGKSLDELSTIVRTCGLTKHGEIVQMLKSTLGMGHGDATTLVQVVKQAAAASEPAAVSGDAVLDGLYTGAKAALRPIHDALLTAMRAVGPFEEAPKKSYISYRRAKQFCMVGPATNTRVEVNLNMKGVPATDRLEALPAGQMCQYKVRVTDVTQVDDELLGWIRHAYNAAG